MILRLVKYFAGRWISEYLGIYCNYFLVSRCLVTCNYCIGKKIRGDTYWESILYRHSVSSGGIFEEKSFLHVVIFELAVPRITVPKTGGASLAMKRTVPFCCAFSKKIVNRKEVIGGS